MVTEVKLCRRRLHQPWNHFLRASSLHLSPAFVYSAVPVSSCKCEQEDVEWDNKGEGLNARDKFIKQHTTFPFGRHDDMVDANSQGLSRIIKIITGEIKPAKHKSSIRYTKWREDMWEDYNALKTDEDREAYFRAFGYPEEWEDEEDIDYQTSIRKSC